MCPTHSSYIQKPCTIRVKGSLLIREVDFETTYLLWGMGPPQFKKSLIFQLLAKIFSPPPSQKKGGPKLHPDLKVPVQLLSSWKTDC